MKQDGIDSIVRKMIYSAIGRTIFNKRNGILPSYITRTRIVHMSPLTIKGEVEILPS
jgi:hypothetical protein